MQEKLWAEPRLVTSLDDCYFYHTMDIPNHQLVHGEWDLRNREDSYLGNVNFQGKRVLEIGTASGHLCFTMERMGAEVVAYDLSDEEEWDVVPFAGYNIKERVEMRKRHMRRINNGFWLAHGAYNSNARVVYGTIYQIPDDLGVFDVCTFGSVLMHLRDPFLALQRASAHVAMEGLVVVTEKAIKLSGKDLEANKLARGRLARFLPNPQICQPDMTWWHLAPELVIEFLKVLGFVNTKLLFHRQLYRGKEVELYTIVARKGLSTE